MDIKIKEDSIEILKDTIEKILFNKLNKGDGIEISELGVEIKKEIKLKSINFIGKKNKIVSVNTFIKKNFKNISEFIETYTTFKIKKMITVS